MLNELCEALAICSAMLSIEVQTLLTRGGNQRRDYCRDSVLAI